MIITVASVFAGCNSGKTDLETNKVMLTDTSGIHNGSATSDTGAAVKTGAKPAAVSKTTHSEKTGTTTSTSGNSGNAASTNNGTTTTTTTTTTTQKERMEQQGKRRRNWWCSWRSWRCNY